MSTTLIIKNPGNAVASIEAVSDETLTPDNVIREHGSKIEYGAFVALIERDYYGYVEGAQLFIADRIDSSLYLQTNDTLTERDERLINAVGTTIALGDAPLPDPEPELETFTVFGVNDDRENFVAVIAATEETAREVGVAAGLVDAGYEADVVISAILRGDHSDAEIVTV